MLKYASATHALVARGLGDRRSGPRSVGAPPPNRPASRPGCRPRTGPMRGPIRSLELQASPAPARPARRPSATSPEACQKRHSAATRRRARLPSPASIDQRIADRRLAISGDMRSSHSPWRDVLSWSPTSLANARNASAWPRRTPVSMPAPARRSRANDWIVRSIRNRARPRVVGTATIRLWSASSRRSSSRSPPGAGGPATASTCSRSKPPSKTASRWSRSWRSASRRS